MAPSATRQHEERMEGVSEYLLRRDEVSNWRSLGGHHGRSIKAVMYIVVRLCA